MHEREEIAMIKILNFIVIFVYDKRRRIKLGDEKICGKKTLVNI